MRRAFEEIPHIAQARHARLERGGQRRLELIEFQTRYFRAHPLQAPFFHAKFRPILAAPDKRLGVSSFDAAGRSIAGWRPV